MPIYSHLPASAPRLPTRNSATCSLRRTPRRAWPARSAASCRAARRAARMGRASGRRGQKMWCGCTTRSLQTVRQGGCGSAGRVGESLGALLWYASDGMLPTMHSVASALPPWCSTNFFYAIAPSFAVLELNELAGHVGGAAGEMLMDDCAAKVRSNGTRMVHSRPLATLWPLHGRSPAEQRLPIEPFLALRPRRPCCSKRTTRRRAACLWRTRCWRAASLARPRRCSAALLTAASTPPGGRLVWPSLAVWA